MERRPDILARRAIDIREGEQIDARAFKALVKAAVARNVAAPTARPVKLLSGGNPQIAKGDIGKRLDALIVKSVPKVRKAVKWNSPFYGLDRKGRFLVFHTFTRYVRVTFFRGTSLKPVPPVAAR